ncbi:MAG: hypothetical protein NWE89_06055 [Candidatus Bathyarchaeota archaeon]|nr:hypothetical protein [Candidatus Bathyarchaeota archaeon]
MSDAASKIMDGFFKHQGYLNSLADLIRIEYPVYQSYNCRDTLSLVKFGKTHFSRIREKTDFDFSLALKNMRNAWYHEAAFNQDNRLSAEERMKFTAWKIIQFYYSVYCGLSAMMRCTNNAEQIGHKKMINLFTNDLLLKENTKNFFPQPFCFVLNSHGYIQPEFSSKIDWDYGLRIKCPQIEQCLKEVSNGHKTSIFHYFLELRNWVNYEDSYIFRRLYSDKAKPQMFNDMQLILMNFLSITELYLMKAYSPKKIIEMANTFINEFSRYMEPVGIPLSSRSVWQLNNRVQYYIESLERIDD